MISRNFHFLFFLLSLLPSFPRFVDCTDFSSSPINLGISGSLVAFVDFNSDKLTDLVTVESTRDGNSVLQVHLYGQSSGSEELYSSPSRLSAQFTGSITNVAAADFNSDGRVDLLVSYHASSSSTISLSILFGSLDSFSNSNSPLSLAPALSQPLIMDWNGDFLVDLYSVSAETGERSVWLNQFNAQSGPRFSLVAHNITALNGRLSPSPLIAVPLYTALADSAASSFVDVNGDCLSDLFLVSQDSSGAVAVELWLNRQRDGFQLVWNQRLDASISSGLGVPVWEDLNSDGTMDLALPLCLPRSDCSLRNELHLFFNIQKPMCGNVWESSSSACRGQQSLCEADDKFYLDPLNAALVDPSFRSGHHVTMDASMFSPLRFSTSDSSSNPLTRPPMTVRFGDTNLDGYPELMLTLQQSSAEYNPITLIYQNVGCSDALCGSAASASGRRTFVHSGFQSVAGSYLGAFLDVDNNGKLDLVFSLFDSQRLATRTAIFYNSGEYDAYFLTALVGNGVCPAWCDQGDKFPSPKPYGAAQPGAVVKFTLTDLEGRKRPRMAVQLSSSAHLALRTPYCFFGLDRTNNYIEEFFVGMPSAGRSYWQLWVAMIPNSQVVVFPYPPLSPDEWTMELFISPSNQLIAVTIALLSVLAANALVIAFFQYRENKEDEKEKNKNELLFTF